MSSDDKKEQSNRVRQNIPSGYFLHREESTERSYHKSCLECDTEIKNGDYYVSDGIAIQFCLDCAETREWSDESDDDDDEEEKIRVANLRRLLPSKYEVREVTGSHRKPCSDCGKQSWSCGDYYVFDSSNPYGTAKFCIECAEHRDWGNERDGEEEIIRSNYIRQHGRRDEGLNLYQIQRSVSVVILDSPMITQQRVGIILEVYQVQ